MIQQLFSSAIMIAFCLGTALGVAFPATGNFHPLGMTVGIALMAASWFAARLQPGAACTNYCGTAFYGKIKVPEGLVMTKWICFGIPLVPVRSYVCSERGVAVETHTWMLSQTNYNLSKLPGLGLNWRSVGKTVIWTWGLLLAAAGVFSLVQQFQK